VGGSIVCGKHYLNHQNQALNASASKAKGRLRWRNEGLSSKHLLYLLSMIAYLEN